MQGYWVVHANKLILIKLHHLAIIQVVRCCLIYVKVKEQSLTILLSQCSQQCSLDRNVVTFIILDHGMLVCSFM